MKKMQRDELVRQGIKSVSPSHSAGEKQPRSFEFTGLGGRGSSRDMTPENTSFRGAIEPSS
jgi:hypothetical protein